MCQKLPEVYGPSARSVAITPFNVQSLKYTPAELARQREAIIQEELAKNADIQSDEMIELEWQDNKIFQKNSNTYINRENNAHKGEKKAYYKTPTLYEIAQLLVNKAKERKIITYGELSHELDDRIIARALPRRLTQINDIAINNDVPLLSALVVNAKSMIPGEGFFGSFAPELAPHQWEGFWREKLTEIWDCDDWERLLIKLKES